jgi:hypothetical protein
MSDRLRLASDRDLTMGIAFDGSFDIIIHIQKFLDPVDILALRLVSAPC